MEETQTIARSRSGLALAIISLGVASCGGGSSEATIEAPASTPAPVNTVPFEAPTTTSMEVTSTASAEPATTAAAASLAEIDTEQLAGGVWQQRATELIGDESKIDLQLLSAVTDLLYCAAPNDRVKAEVIALLMRDECTAHQIQLSQVAPSIIATQVYQLAEPDGFGPAPQRVKKLLRGPLLAAAEHKEQSLSLRVRA